MTELNSGSLEYVYAYNDLCEAIRENITNIENNPPGDRYKSLVRDAIAHFSQIINRNVSIDVIPRDYQLHSEFQRFIYILPSPQSAAEGEEKEKEKEKEEDQPEIQVFNIRRIPHDGLPLRFNRLQLCTFMCSLRRFSPDERMPETEDPFDECGICLQCYFQPRNLVSITAANAQLITENALVDKEFDYLPSMDQPEAPAQLPCGHIFGEICVQRWIVHEASGNPPNCPLCRGVWMINEEGNVREFVVNL